MQPINRRRFLKLCGQLALGGGLAVCGGYSYAKYVEPEWLVVEHIHIPLKTLPPALEGFKIVHLSDIHLHPHTQIEQVRDAVNLANSLKPDLAAITGDFVLAGPESIFELAPALAGLNPKYGIFTVLGNHDRWTNFRIVIQGLQEAGIPVLSNEGRLLSVGKASLYLAGLDDIWSGQPDLRQSLAAAPPDVTTILLAHEPDFADVSSLDGRVDVQLSGHSHGGQVRLPGIGAPILPFMGRKYDQGLYRVNGMWLYTTRGVGLGRIPYRINCPPEVTEITLTRA